MITDEDFLRLTGWVWCAEGAWSHPARPTLRYSTGAAVSEQVEAELQVQRFVLEHLRRKDPRGG